MDGIIKTFLFLALTACLEPHGQVPEGNTSSDVTANSLNLELIDTAGSSISSDTIIFENKDGVLNLMSSDGSYRVLDGDVLSAQKSGTSDQLNSYKSSNGLEISLNDQTIVLKTETLSAPLKIDVNLNLSSAKLKYFGSKAFALSLGGYTYFIEEVEDEFQIIEDIEAVKYTSIAECSSGCSQWTIYQGKTHYRDGDGDWLEVSDSNIDVSAIQASKIAGKLSVSESGEATFESLYFINTSNELYKWKSSENSPDTSELDGFEKVLALAKSQGCVRCHSNDGYDSEEVWKNDAAKIIDRISVENKGAPKLCLLLTTQQLHL